MRRRLLPILALLILAAGAAFWWWTRPLPVLNIVTWPGLYGRAQAAAQILPYGTARRVDARIQQWAANGTLDELRSFITAHRADVVDLELPVAAAACKAGLLESIDSAALLPGDDGTEAQKDFYKGMIGPCFAASAVYGQMIVCWKPCRHSLAELFQEARRNPGPPPGQKPSFDTLMALTAQNRKIGLQRTAKITLEMALLADGVNPDEVYSLLATDAGVARAFATLDSIKPNIVWWRAASEPAQLLRSRQVVATTMLTADAQATAGNSDLSALGTLFYEADVLAIPKGGANRERALDYLHYATGTLPLANMVKFAPYAPPRRSARAMVAALPSSPTRDFVMGQGDALDHGFAIDDIFWAEHGSVLEARFRAWMDRP